MRRILPFVLSAALLSACDPTGNGLPAGNGVTHFRFSNYITDAPGINVYNTSGLLISNIGFAGTSLYQSLSPDSSIFTLKQATDAFQLGVDTVVLIADRRYALYGLGKVTALKPLLLANDTLLAAAGTYKIRFIHGVVSYSPFSIDFFDDTTSSLTGLTPSWPGLSYGTASNYVVVDTGVRRIRLTKGGVPATLLLDTTMAAIPSGAVVTLVATNVAPSTSGYQIHIVTDTTP